MTWVKICGITDDAALEAAVEAGADAVGFVFHPPSRRYIPPGQAQRLADRAGGRTLRVGVVVDQRRPAVETILDSVPLDAVQWAGGPVPDWAHDLGSHLHIGVLRLAPGDPWPPHLPPAWAYLLEAPGPPGTYGGNGRPGLWPAQGETGPVGRLILSGGLHAENVPQAVRHTRPFGVDVSSGVETDGKKDPQKIRAFVEAVRRDADGA